MCHIAVYEELLNAAVHLHVISALISVSVGRVNPLMEVQICECFDNIGDLRHPCL